MANRNLTLKVKNPGAEVVDAKMELPRPYTNEYPCSVITAGGKRTVFYGSGDAGAAEVPVDTHILRHPERMTAAPPISTIAGFDAEIFRNRRYLMTDYEARAFYWKKNYCGTFNVDLMPADADHPAWIYSLTHCENKNEKVERPYGTFYFHNSINLADPAGPETSSGMRDGRYQDYQPAYFGLVSLVYSEVGPHMDIGQDFRRNDLGPVVWPHTGFLTPDGKQKHPGYKNPHPHPSCLIAEDPKDGQRYIYIWLLDSSTRGDAQTMVVAARSPLASRGRPGTWMNFYKGDYTEPSLPTNMSGTVQELASRPGGKADAIHPTAHERVNRFFVARMKRSGLFLGIETFREGEEMATALRLSEDLRTWTDRMEIPNTRVPSPYTRKDSRSAPFCLTYPKFLSADGATHYEVDESEPFYIIATKPHALVYRELEIEIG